MIIWFFFLNLLMWWIILIDSQILNQTRIPRINSIWSLSIVLFLHSWIQFANICVCVCVCVCVYVGRCCIYILKRYRCIVLIPCLGISKMLDSYNELKLLASAWASWVVQLAKKKICLQCRRPWFDSWVRKFPWERDRLPAPVFLDFPGGSESKESTHKVGDLGSISSVFWKNWYNLP